MLPFHFFSLQDTGARCEYPQVALRLAIQSHNKDVTITRVGSPVGGTTTRVGSPWVLCEYPQVALRLAIRSHNKDVTITRVGSRVGGTITRVGSPWVLS